MLRVKPNFRNNLFFLIIFSVLFLFAASLLPHIAIRFSLLSLGGKISMRLVAPDILLCGAIATGILYDRNYASVMGLVFGFLSDRFLHSPFLLCTLLYFLAGYFAPQISQLFSKKTPLTMLLASAPLIFARSIISCFYHIATNPQLSIGTLFIGTLIPEYIYNIFAAVIMFLFINISFKLFCGGLKR